MSVMLIVRLFLLFSTTIIVQAGLLSWLFNRGSSEDRQPALINADPDSREAILAKIPFELMTTDDKFLNEAETYLGKQLSTLDVCHHRIIIGLQKTCGQMTEEDLGKLSVNLLNCQSSVEGRTIFPCTADMTLKQCTKSMDSDTWNAYLIISNRARAVCYTIRNQQFRAKSEMTVERLAYAAQQQLNALSSIQKGQDNIEKLTSSTLHNIAFGHKQLLEQQELLHDSQKSIQFYVASNLKELTREKSLIAAGQKELVALTDEIKLQLDIAGKQLHMQEKNQRESTELILEDLSGIQKKAQQVWEKIDNSTQKILQQHLKTVEQYQETLENLQRVNATINYLLVVFERTRTEVDDKLKWLTELVGGTGIQLAVLMTSLQHLGYLILGATALIFLNAPVIMRLLLLLAVSLNIIVEINYGCGFDFIGLSLIIASLFLAIWVYSGICYGLNQKRITFSSWKSSITQVAQMGRKSLMFRSVNLKEKQISADESSSEDANFLINGENILPTIPSTSLLAQRNWIGNTPNKYYPEELHYEEVAQNSTFKVQKETMKQAYKNSELFDDYPVRKRTSSRASTPTSFIRESTPIRGNSLSRSPSSKQFCQGIGKKGQPCKLHCAAGEKFCHIHL